MDDFQKSLEETVRKLQAQALKPQGLTPAEAELLRRTQAHLQQRQHQEALDRQRSDLTRAQIMGMAAKYGIKL